MIWMDLLEIDLLWAALVEHTVSGFTSGEAARLPGKINDQKVPLDNYHSRLQ
jgi:hypothetical protein